MYGLWSIIKDCNCTCISLVLIVIRWMTDSWTIIPHLQLFGFRKLTDEEKQRRLEEMMDNAKWREENRNKNVKRYKEEDKQEEVERSKSRTSGFLT